MARERFNPTSDKMHAQLLKFFLDDWPPSYATKIFKHLKTPSSEDISSLIWTARVWLEHWAIEDPAARRREGDYERWLHDALANAYSETRASSSTLFNPGKIVVTPGVNKGFSQIEQRLALDRHVRGNWGTVSSEDKRANDDALFDGSQILSAYDFGDGKKLWIVSEPETSPGRRPVTTLLLPSEY